MGQIHLLRLPAQQALLEYEAKQDKHFKSVAELVKAVKTAVGELYDARAHTLEAVKKRKVEDERESIKRQKTMVGAAKEKAVKDAGAGGAGLPADKQGTIFDFKAADANKMPVLSALDFAAMDSKNMNKPFIVQGIASLTELMGTDVNFKKEVSDNISAFRVDPNRQSGSKALVVDGGLQKTLGTLMFQHMPKFTNYVFPPDGDKLMAAKLEECRQPDFWLRASGSAPAPSAEPLGLASLRFTLQGARTIVAATLPDLGSYVRTEKGSRALKQPISSHATMLWMKSANPEAVTKAIDAGVGLWYGTVSTGDMLFLPTGTVKYEKILVGEDLSTPAPHPSTLHLATRPVSRLALALLACCIFVGTCVLAKQQN